MLVSVIGWNGCEIKEESPFSFHVYSQVDTNVVTIGDIVHFQIWAKGAGKRIINFPEIIINNPDVSVGERRSLEGNYQDDYGVDFEIAFWDTGSFSIPAYSVNVMSNTGDSIEYSLTTDPIDVKIPSVIKDPEPVLRDIKNPVPLPLILPIRIIISSVIIVILVGVLIWIWRKRIPGKKDQPKIHIPPRPPYEIAMEKLERLRNFEILKPAQKKEFYVELSYTVREYLEYQFFVRAIEMTTEDIINSRSYLPFSEDLIDILLDVLKRADLAKFARFQLDRNQCTKDLETIEDLVTKSRIGWLPVDTKPFEWRMYD